MNIILFEAHEAFCLLLRRDERTIHLLKVLHKKEGDFFEAGILGGNSGSGKIEKIHADGSICFTLNLHTPPLARLPIRVAVGFPRPIQIRRLLRDLSSMGVQAIDFFGTELGEKSYRSTTLFADGGAHAALIEGAAQSRDTILPEINIFGRLEEWIEKNPPLTECNGSSALLIAADNVRPQGTFTGIASAKRPVVLAIGSERGWSDRERNLLETAGFMRLSLGSRALRTETACIAATALLMNNERE
ncbi:MAG: 16S rRNA (uracil(1498)-N(3))-methyltransferase [Treponema sp.]|nr:16S rRNA (uracil(1498)-N(3))-methyltransferase [Treponema sp.]